MQKYRLIILTIFCMLILAGCGCEHEWVDADCDTPKTCTLCQETEDAPLGHSWLAATCDTAKICEVCGTTEGDPMGHSWADATCTDAKNCTACKLTEGEALGHTWLEATTEAPKTCQTCSLTEGERIITDERFTTAACSPLFGSWTGQISLPGAALGNGLDAYVTELPCLYNITFSNSGNVTINVQPADETQMQDIMLRYTIDLMYQEFAGMGIDAETANAAMQQTYGMTIEDYVASQLDTVDITSIFNALNVEYVYYVKGDQIYMGVDWNSEMSSEEFKMENEKLYLSMDSNELVAFTRVTE